MAAFGEYRNALKPLIERPFASLRKRKKNRTCKFELKMLFFTTASKLDYLSFIQCGRIGKSRSGLKGNCLSSRVKQMKKGFRP